MSTASTVLYSVTVLTLGAVGFLWQKEYRGLGAAIAASPAPPAPYVAAANTPVAVPPTLAAAVAADDTVKEPPPLSAPDAAPAVKVDSDPLSFAPGPAASAASSPAIEASLNLAGNPGSLAVITSSAGPLIRLRGQDGTDRLGVVIEPAVALGPIMEIAYNPEVQRLESLATEPLSIFSVKSAVKTVPVVNPLGEHAGINIKVCGMGDVGFECVPGKLRQGPFYHAADDRVLLEAGGFNAEFMNGAALFKTGAGGGLMGYQPEPVDGKHAFFIPVNYAGRFSSMRDSLGPLLSVAFSDILIHGRNDAAYASAPTSAPSSTPGSAPKSTP